jgi:hypothetical protein
MLQFVAAFLAYLAFLLIMYLAESLGYVTHLNHLSEVALVFLIVLFGTGAFLHLTRGWRGYLPGLCTAFCLSCIIGGFGVVYVAGHAVVTFFSNCRGFN